MAAAPEMEGHIVMGDWEWDSPPTPKRAQIRVDRRRDLGPTIVYVAVIVIFIIVGDPKTSVAPRLPARPLASPPNPTP